MPLEGFGMTVGGFFFPCFKKHSGSGISAFYGSSADDISNQSSFSEDTTLKQSTTSITMFLHTSERSSPDDEVFVAKRVLLMSSRHFLKREIVMKRKRNPQNFLKI